MNRIARKRIEMQRRRDLYESTSVDVSTEERDFKDYFARGERQGVFNAVLREQGKLGVASSIDVLMANISRMTENPEDYFLSAGLQEVMDNPEQVAYGNFGKCEIVYWAGRYDGRKPETVSVLVESSKNLLAEMTERARRNLAYKILRREGSHGANFKMRVGDNSVFMSAVPIVCTKE